MTPPRHTAAIARLVVAAVDAQPRGARRLGRSHLRCAAERPEAALAGGLGVIALIEQARDDHLQTLDADDGLAALGVAWEDVVAEAVALLDRPPPRDCPRCGGRLSRRRPVCGRCRSPAPRG